MISKLHNGYNTENIPDIATIKGFSVLMLYNGLKVQQK